MSIIVSREDVKIFEKLRVISLIAPIKERIKFFEKKYGCKFEVFENKIRQQKENFEQWDDYIEWKAYNRSLRDLEAKLLEIESAKDIRIT